MTVARSMQINLDQTRYYHVVSRGVRRAFLCGWDQLTRKNFDHRKEGLVERMKTLSSIFSIHCAAYAAMQNHLHLCVYVDCEQAAKWRDDEVICRWGKLFPGRLAGLYARGDAVALEYRQALRECVPRWRERLSNLSGYMKCLKEYIARKANKEDDVNGYFWQGRFRCPALLDEAAVLVAMCYIEINPIRARAAATPRGIGLYLGTRANRKLASRYHPLQTRKTKRRRIDTINAVSTGSRTAEQTKCSR